MGLGVRAARLGPSWGRGWSQWTGLEAALAQGGAGPLFPWEWWGVF